MTDARLTRGLATLAQQLHLGVELLVAGDGYPDNFAVLQGIAEHLGHALDDKGRLLSERQPHSGLTSSKVAMNERASWAAL